MSEVQFSIMLSRLLMVILCIGQSIEGNNRSSLTQLSDCTCLGYIQTFECVVFGAGITIWQGTAFDFPCVIRLRHSQYNDSGAVGECNNGAIIARSVGVSGDLYTSQLNITISQDIINETIECVHDDTVGNRLTIGTMTLKFNITTEDYSPILLVDSQISKQNQLRFSWNEVPTNCSFLEYIITETNCGLCPNTTTDTNITCFPVYVTSISVCTFAIQAEICGELVGNMSESENVTLSPQQTSGFNSTTVYPDKGVHRDRESTVSTNVSTVIAPVSVLIAATSLLLIFWGLLLIIIIKRKRIKHTSGQITNTYEVPEACINTNQVNSPSTDDHEGIYSLLQPVPHDAIEEPKSDQERVIVYVDIGPNSIQCRPQLNICYTDDDKVEYSNIIHQPMNSKKDTQFQVDNFWDKCKEPEAESVQEPENIKQPPPLATSKINS